MEIKDEHLYSEPVIITVQGPEQSVDLELASFMTVEDILRTVLRLGIGGEESLTLSKSSDWVLRPVEKIALKDSSNLIENRVVDGAILVLQRKDEYQASLIPVLPPVVQPTPEFIELPKPGFLMKYRFPMIAGGASLLCLFAGTLIWYKMHRPVTTAPIAMHSLKENLFELYGQDQQAQKQTDTSLKSLPKSTSQNTQVSVSVDTNTNSNPQNNQTHIVTPPPRVIDHSSAMTWYNKAVAEFQNNNTSEAIADYNKAIEADFRYEPAYRNLGNMYLRFSNNPSEAISDYKQAVNLDSGDYYAWIGLAQAQSQLGQHSAALQTLDRAASALPSRYKAAISEMKQELGDS